MSNLLNPFKKFCLGYLLIYLAKFYFFVFFTFLAFQYLFNSTNFKYLIPYSKNTSNTRFSGFFRKSKLFFYTLILVQFSNFHILLIKQPFILHTFNILKK